MQKEIAGIISNALVAFGSIGLSTGFALPFTALQVFVDYPENPAAQARANEYAQLLNNATYYFLGVGMATLLVGIGIGMAPWIRISWTGKLVFVAACVLIIGGVFVYELIFRPPQLR